MDRPITMLFREDQRFRGQWLMLLIGACSLSALAYGLALIVGQVILHHPVGAKPLPDVVALVLGLMAFTISGGLLWLCWVAVLKVEVTHKGLFVRFEPFHRRTRQIDLNEVTAITAVSYRPMRDYGGWGMRRGVRSRCYNVSGETGVRIDYANGYHVLIGSQRSRELESALHTIWQAPATELETP